jgi:hypothetical protein
MRQWILAGILVIIAGWEGWVLFQRHHENTKKQPEAMLATPYLHATQAFYDAHYELAEKLITDILPDAEKSYAHDLRLANLLNILGTSYRVDHKYEQAEPPQNRLHIIMSILFGPLSR